jgi:hypothetical protein
VASEQGTASVEWVGLVLVVSLALGAVTAAVPAVDGRSFGGYLAHAIVCAATGDCAHEDEPLTAAYGARDAALLRRHAPNLVYEAGERSLPIDFRDCRIRRCSRAPDDPRLDAHYSDAGRRATVFTHVVHRGRETFLQYWMYYPYSNTTIGNPREGIGAKRIPFDVIEKLKGLAGGPVLAPVAGKQRSIPGLNPWALTDRAIRSRRPEPDAHPRVSQMPKWWERMPFTARSISWFFTERMGAPGFHHDDWEGYQVRLDSAGRAAARSSSHGGWQWCKYAECAGDWGEETGWSRVSYGSHAGHVPVNAVRDHPGRPFATGVGRARPAGRAPRRGPGPRRFEPALPGADLRERTTTSAGLRLVPLESIDRGAYTRRDDQISPPWEKEVYRDPLAPGA